MSRYKINIMEHQYYINTDRDPAWVKMLQERLNGQIDEIREGCPNLSAFDTFALLTMNLMDQLAKSEEAAANLRQQLTNYLRESSAVRAPGDDYRRAGQMDFRDYDENVEEHAAITEMAERVVSLGPLAGLGTYDIYNDYYDLDMNYKLVRNAIQTLNPSK